MCTKQFLTGKITLNLPSKLSEPSKEGSVMSLLFKRTEMNLMGLISEGVFWA